MSNEAQHGQAGKSETQNPRTDVSESLDHLISDECLRLRIRKVIEEKPESKIERYSKHPLVTLLFGFLLTWYVGGILTDHYKEAQLDKDRSLAAIQARREAGIKAVSEFSQLVYERRVRTELLASALSRRSAREELLARKAAYDEVYVRWNKEIPRNQLAMRDAFGNLEYSELETYVQYGLTPHFSMLDKYVTAGFDALTRGDDWRYDSGFVKTHLDSALECAYVITNRFWVAANNFGRGDPESRASLEATRKELEDRCPKR